MVNDESEFEKVQSNWEVSRQTIAHCLSNGLDSLGRREHLMDRIARAVAEAVVITAAIPLGYLAIILLWACLALLRPVFGPAIDWSLLAVPILVALFGVTIKDQKQSGSVKKKHNAFLFARLDDIVRGSHRNLAFAFLAFFFGSHIAILQWFPSQLAVVDNGFGNCLLTAVDSVLKSLLLDVIEVFDLSLVSKQPHNSLSSNVFQGYRFGFQFCFVLLIWSALKARNVRKLLSERGLSSADPEVLSVALRRFLARRNELPWELNDDLIFLLICERYLEGDLEAAEGIGLRFPDIAVENEVRALFVDAEGHELLPPMPTEQEAHRAASVGIGWQLAPLQQRVLNMISKSIRSLRLSFVLTAVSYVLVFPFIALISILLSSIVGFGLASALQPIADTVGNWVFICFAILPITLTCLGLWFQNRYSRRGVQITRSGLSFELGRISSCFQLRSHLFLVVLFGILFGVQLGMLSSAMEQIGLNFENNISNCVALTCDNVIFGVLLDYCEINNYSFAGPARHSLISGIIFLTFRICYEVVAVTILFLLGKALLLRTFIFSPDLVGGNPEQTTISLAKSLSNKEKFPRQFFDELIFLIMVTQNLVGDTEGVSVLSRSLGGNLKISDEALRLVEGREPPISTFTVSDK